MSHETIDRDLSTTVQAYKKKPVIINAIKLHEHSLTELYEFMGIKNKGSFLDCGHGIDPHDGKFKITTLEGVMIAEVGDFIIKGLNGEFYPCKPDIFNKSYEMVISSGVVL